MLQTLNTIMQIASIFKSANEQKEDGCQLLQTNQEWHFCRGNTDADKRKQFALLIFTHKLPQENEFMFPRDATNPCLYLNTGVTLTLFL